MLRLCAQKYARLISVASVFLAVSCQHLNARELHLDCSRPSQGAMVDLDTDRRFLQLMWSDGVAEEFQQGAFYISAPDKNGNKRKVVSYMTAERDHVDFGVDHLCLEEATKPCAPQHIGHRLDLSRNQMSYADGETIGVFACVPGPVGRRF